MSPSLHTSTVLVLNRCWQAIDVKTPAEAFAMMATGSASALDIAEGALRPVSWREWLTLTVREQDTGVGTARGLVRSPTVLVLARYARMPRRRLTFSRRGLWHRDGGVCQYSGRRLQFDEANIDHVIPRSRGGPTSWENCVLADKRVNHRKGDRTPEEAGLRLARDPQIPRELPATAFIRNNHGILDWELFLV
jgi:5-methylcytosine-specific restriction endonuclease McrA